MAERRSVDPDVVGSIPTSRPNATPSISVSVPGSDLMSSRDKKQSSDRHPVYLGCSGWAYPTWKPGFYPAKTSALKMLPYYSSQLNTVEVNYTFRRLPKPATIAKWLAAVDGTEFRFSFKAPQGITHFKRLVECEGLLEHFLQAIEPVASAGRMGLVLFQLPPNFKADVARLTAFLKMAGGQGKPRFAFEFRHASWFAEESYAVLRHANAALCVAGSDELDSPDVTTADFSCYRLRKAEYTPEELAALTTIMLEKARHGDVFAYFKHEDEPHGPLRAREVLRQVRAS